MLNNAFPCNAEIRSVEYYRTQTNGTVFVGIWKQVGQYDFVLVHKIVLPPDSIGVNRVTMETPLEVLQGEIVGLYYPLGVSTGIIPAAFRGDQGFREQEFYPTVKVDLYADRVWAGIPVDIIPYRPERLYTTFAIQLNLDYPTPTVRPPVTPSTVGLKQSTLHPPGWTFTPHVSPAEGVTREEETGK